MPDNDKDILIPHRLTPEQTKVLDCLWRLFFKRGMNPRGELVFAFNGPKESAIKRGREFCIRMNYKFIHVEPFFVDLDETERNYKGEDRPVTVVVKRSA